MGSAEEPGISNINGAKNKKTKDITEITFSNDIS